MGGLAVITKPPPNAIPIRSTGRGGGAIIGYKIGNATYDTAGQATNAAAKANSYDGKTLFGAKYIPGSGGGLFGGISDAFTQFFEDPAKATTQALQPVEKTVNYIGAHPEMQLALAMAVAAPYASAEIAGYLTTAGLSEAAAATAASAITSITVQVAQGVPIEKATENALVNVAVSGATSVVQQQIGKVISSPGVTNAITSTVSSGLSTAARGGSQADVEKAMTAGLAGSTASTIYKEAVDASSDVISKAVGGATSGAVTGGTEGAVTGGLSAAAGALGSNLAKPTTKPADTAALPPGQVAALEGAVSPDTTSQSDVDTGQASIKIPPTPVAGLDLTKEQTPAPVTEPKQGAFLPSTTPTTADQKILDLIAEKPATPGVAAIGEVPPTPDKTPVTAPPVAVDANIPRVEVSGVGNIEPPQGAYLPDTVPATTEPKQGAFLPETAPAPAEIPAASPMSKDPAQKAAEAIDTSTVPAADKQILDLIAETPDQSEAETARLAAKEAELAASEKGAYLPDSGTDTKTTTYKPDLFTTTYLSPKTRTVAAPTSALGSALGTTGLTSYRGAGEIEGTGTGKPRKKVWNEESLKLKDALGV